MKQPGVGDIVGEKYVLEGIIGRGGFATVYKGRDVRIDRTVAVKVLNPGESGYPLTTASRFQREARALAALNDPHTIRMFDYGRTEHGVLFMVFELLKGLDLSQHLSVVKTMSERDTIHVLEQMLSSLREAHAAGILHRDIKPGNIRIYEYMDDSLRAKLIDFGIVRLLDADAASLTKTGYVVGTIRYMSPEQARGEELTPASDLFTLGLVAHEMLTGDQRPAAEVISTPLQLPVSSGFQRILQRMLARDVRDRYQSAGQVLDALGAIRGSQSTSQEQFDEFAPTTEQSPAEIMGAFREPPASTSQQSYESYEPPPPRPVSLGAVAGLAAVCFCVGLGAVLLFEALRDDDVSTHEQRELGGLVRPRHESVRVESIESLPSGEQARPRADAGVAAADGGCGAAAENVGKIATLSMVDGLQRIEWNAYVPAGYEPSRKHPLVVLFHSDASQFGPELRAQKLTKLADEKQFLVIGPSMETLGTYSNGVEPATLRQMVEATKDRYCVDAGRIFAYGVGGGGGGVESISCESWVAATATTSFRYESDKSMCSAKRPVPTLYLAQMKSKNLPTKGGLACGGYWDVISLAEHEQRWKARNRCSGAERITKTYAGSTCVTWDCEVPYVSCRIDGGHTWVGSHRLPVFSKCDGPPADFPHGETIWEFFMDATAGTPRPADL